MQVQFLNSLLLCGSAEGTVASAQGLRSIMELLKIDILQTTDIQIKEEEGFHYTNRGNMIWI